MMTDRIAVVSISTADYWPYTAVLLESLARVCPEWEVYILALNEVPQIPPDRQCHNYSGGRCLGFGNRAFAGAV